MDSNTLYPMEVTCTRDKNVYTWRIVLNQNGINDLIREVPAGVFSVPKTLVIGRLLDAMLETLLKLATQGEEALIITTCVDVTVNVTHGYKNQWVWTLSMDRTVLDTLAGEIELSRSALEIASIFGAMVVQMVKTSNAPTSQKED